MSDANSLSAAVAAFIPLVHAWNREVNVYVVCVGGPPIVPAYAATPQRKEELRAEIMRTGEELYRELIRGDRSELAVDLRERLNWVKEDKASQLTREWNRLKARLQVAAEQEAASKKGAKGPLASPTGKPTPQQLARKGNRTHAESNDPKRNYKANLYALIRSEKKPREGAKALATRLKRLPDVVELVQEAGLPGLSEKVVNAALQAGRRQATE